MRILVTLCILLTACCPKQRNGITLASTKGELSTMVPPVILVSYTKTIHIRTKELGPCSATLMDAKGKIVTYEDTDGVATIIAMEDMKIGDTIFKR